MSEDRPQFSWPGLEYSAALLEGGWVHVMPPGGMEFGFLPPITDAPPAGTRALVIKGERLAAIRALADVSPRCVKLAYFDVPRLGHAEFAIEHLRTATWLSALRSHVSVTKELLSPDGTIVIHVDDRGAALAMAALEDLFGRSPDLTILWQKKYAAQNDLSGRIDDAQDYLLVFTALEDAIGAVRTTWWSWQYAGKSEDATREAEALRANGVVALQTIPKTSKPAKLVGRLLDAFTTEGDVVLEGFSDTGFASAAALAKGRRCILLTGSTASELERAALCAVPRLQHSAGPKSLIRVVDVSDPGYSRAAVSAINQPIRIASVIRSVPQLREVRFLKLEATGETAVPSAREGFPSLLVVGDTVEALVALEPVVKCDVTLAIVEIDAVSKSESPEVLRTLMEATSRLLAEQGVVAFACSPSAYGWTRLEGELEVFGLGQYLGTVARQHGDSGYTLYPLFKALPNARAGKIGLRKERDYKAKDGDPRGPWRAPGHKGARSGSKNTAFEYRLPPYRWEFVSGQLPPGAWQINGVSGVIWAARLTAAGEYRFTVRVTDSRNRTSTAECTIQVDATGTPSHPAGVWWLDAAELQHSSGAPLVVETRLPSGVVGEPYSAVLTAAGGKPHDEKTAPGKETDDGKRTRYWEFSFTNLTGAILEDRVVFGQTGTAKPSIKVYEAGETATRVPELSWWDDDRLRHMTAEERLIEMFTDAGQLVLFTRAGSEVAKSPLRTGRRCISIDTHSRPASGYPFRAGLSDVVGHWDSERRAFRPDYTAEDFHTGLAWILGFLPLHAQPGLRALRDQMSDLFGVSSDGASALAFLAPAEWPTQTRCVRIAEALTPSFGKVHVLYYRGKPPRPVDGVAFRRIPFDFAGSR
jgi:hypothetical protein